MARLFRRSAKTPARAENIDELTRLNRGSGVFMAEDTGTQPGFILPYNKTSKEQLFSRRGYQPNPVAEPVPEPEPVPEEVPVEEQPSEPQDNISTFLDFFNYTDSGVASSPDGGVILEDGTSVSPDGTIKNSGGEIITGIASLPGGYTLYSDGSARKAGLENLIKGVFGQDQPITQDYGNQNPGMGYANDTHRGTDIRTRDLEQRSHFIPDDAEVVEMFKDGQNAYGNSILVKLPSGEMLRFSHLASLPNVQVGQRIPGGTPFITPGNTGKSTGEHLDLEYYTPQGQIADPQGFQGFQNTKGTGLAVAPEQLPPEAQQAVSQYQQQQAQPAASTMPRQGQILGAQTTQPSTPTPRAAAGAAINQAGKDLNLPAMGVGEAVAGDLPAAGRELSNTIEQANIAPRIDTGVSELLRGDMEGAKTNFMNTVDRIKKRLNPMPQQAMNEVVKPAYAAEEGQQPQQTLGQNLQEMGQDINQYVSAKTEPVKTFINQASDQVIGMAGQGLEKLKGMFSGGNIQNRPNPSELAGNRAVGGTTAGAASLMPSSLTNVTNSSQRQDVRDPFFKGEGASQFASFINQGANDGTRLSTQMFNDDFYTDKSRVSSVFGGTGLEQEAMSKYQAYEDARRAEEARRMEEQNRQAGGVSSGPQQNFTPSYANTPTSSGMSYVAPAAKPKAIASGPQQNYTPANANYTSMSGAASYAPPPQSQPQQQSLFDRAKQAIAKLFRR